MSTQGRPQPVRQPALEQKAFAFEIKQLTDKGTFEGYASTFGNVDLQDDVIEPGAFKKTISERDSWPLLWHHDPWEPVGLLTDAVEDTHGLAVKGELNLEVQRAREAYALLKQGALGAMSIGYKTVLQSFTGQVRRLLEVKLREVSLVTFPANELALVTGVKHGMLTASEMRELEDLGAMPILSNAIRLGEIAVKEGRVLSQSNADLVTQAVAALQALLDAALGPPKQGTRAGEGAADLHVGPETLSTLRALTTDIKTHTPEVK